jgi:hypothetical protein
VALAEWFEAFCGSLQVRDGGTISLRYKNITRRLNSDFWNTTSDSSHSLYVGSYGRNTATEGFSDLDMLAELPSSLYFQYDGYTGNGQSALLQAVKTSIERTYSTTSSGQMARLLLCHLTTVLISRLCPPSIIRQEAIPSLMQMQVEAGRPQILGQKSKQSAIGTSLAIITLCHSAA